MLKICEHDAVDETAIDAIVKGINEHANKSGFDPTKYIGFSLEDSAGQKVGGIFGVAHWGGLFIDGLWVAENYRGMGHGRVLIEAIEKKAQKLGCNFSCLYTMDFQGLEFYKRMGYSVEFQRSGYQNGAHCYHLVKKF